MHQRSDIPIPSHVASSRFEIHNSDGPSRPHVTKMNVRCTKPRSDADPFNRLLVVVLDAHAPPDVGEEAAARLQDVVVEPDGTLPVALRMVDAAHDVPQSQGVRLEEQREETREEDRRCGSRPRCLLTKLNKMAT